MNTAEFRVHIDAYLNLRGSLGLQTEITGYYLRELSNYVEAQGFSWPIRTQTILEWISAASPHCGLSGQRTRLTQARCFLKHLKASVPDTGPIAAPATPEAPLVLGRRNHRAPAGHAPVVGTRLVIATDSLLDYRIARQHWAPRRRSNRSNGRRCSFRLRSSPTLYP
jgi:hypothetical protein